MLFKRRTPPPMTERVRIALWPRRSWSRSTRYVINRVGRLRGTPHYIALGFACGVGVSFTPLIGFHFLLAGLLAFACRASVIASAFGTFVGNPLTFPLIWVGAYRTGNIILGAGGRFDPKELRRGFEVLWDGFWELSSAGILEGFEILWPLLKPMTVGGLPLGLVTGLMFYYIIRRIVVAYQQRRSMAWAERIIVVEDNLERDRASETEP